jgi:hypothetical protein
MNTVFQFLNDCLKEVRESICSPISYGSIVYQAIIDAPRESEDLGLGGLIADTKLNAIISADQLTVNPPKLGSIMVYNAKEWRVASIMKGDAATTFELESPDKR